VLLREKCIPHANRIVLALVIAVGKLSDPTSLIARVGEELKMQHIFFARASVVGYVRAGPLAVV